MLQTKIGRISLPGVLCTALLWCGIALAQEEPQARPFDHAATGFDLFGAHDFVPCQSCHIGGQFDGTPRRCESCHTPNGRFEASSRPVSHIHSSNQCDTCHSPTLW